MRLSGWGRYPVMDCRVTAPRDEDQLRRLVAAGGAIARGNGRSYGDAALNAGNTVDMRRFDRMLSFSPETGTLVAEAGVLLSDVIATFLPRGWFPAVTPGTKFVTLGGMIAADVHGKNHHLDGSFGRFVDWIDVMGPDGATARCSRSENADLFAWTVGGMGLTGIVLRAAVRLRPVETGWIRQTTLAAPNLDATMNLFESHANARYSVAWIDCLKQDSALGRSLLTLGEHAGRDELPPEMRSAPFDVPVRRPLAVPPTPGLVNAMAVRAFNALYFRRGARRQGTALVDWDRFFYPLDALRDWNRIYGRAGFLQYQCVLPLRAARDGLRDLLDAIARSGTGSFLAVLKRLGEEQGRISFPMPGYTLALDFPVRSGTLALMERLDRITADHGGRIYLAKDSRIAAAALRQADPRVEAFAEMRQAAGLRPAFRSALSERLDL